MIPPQMPITVRLPGLQQQLARLTALRPKKPHYLERAAKTEQKLVAQWNLVVPAALIERAWEQVL